jgi:hypothetical protein
MLSKVVLILTSLMVDGVVQSVVSQDQSKYVNSLEIRLRSSESEVKSKSAELLALQTKLDKQVCLPISKLM